MKSQEFLAEAGIEAKEEVNAKKQTLGKADALELAKTADDIYSSKGKKVVHVNMRKDKPDDELLAELLLGPTGNLRAPTLRMGKTLVVGFDEATYKNVFR